MGFSPFNSRYEFVLGPVTPVNIGETSSLVILLLLQPVTGRVIKASLLPERLQVLVTVCSFLTRQLEGMEN
jgi:hypothetical protein